MAQPLMNVLETQLVVMASTASCTCDVCLLGDGQGVSSKLKDALRSVTRSYFFALSCGFLLMFMLMFMGSYVSSKRREEKRRERASERWKRQQADEQVEVLLKFPSTLRQ
mmetsp:Transcript_3665/g.6227  ORF Transcript_3665/g.6227 Transcript_3665/m.6227 type:complete len:110 (+) Transcript_3665:675-1004(+)